MPFYVNGNSKTNQHYLIDSNQRQRDTEKKTERSRMRGNGREINVQKTAGIIKEIA